MQKSFPENAGIGGEFDAAAMAAYFDRALALAARGEGHTRPNPPVGAVLVAGGAILGEGFHRRAGGDHAEVAALKNAVRRRRNALGFPAPERDGETGDVRDGRVQAAENSDSRPATLFVTLEPCSKPGRVGACTDAIIAAGVSHVYYAVPDPNPVNRGRARKVLNAAGIECECLATDLKALWRRGETAAERALAECVGRARRLIAPFARHVLTGRPFVTVKLAMSLDGKIADDSGEAKWISSAASRRATGRLRERVDAIMVGAETVRRDNPLLLSHGRRNDDLLRVVISRSGELPERARVFTEGANATLVFPDPETALAELGRRGCLSVLCEGGLTLARALADLGVVDEWISVTAPIVIGSRPLADARRFELQANGISDPRVGDRLAVYSASALTTTD